MPASTVVCFALAPVLVAGVAAIAGLAGAGVAGQGSITEAGLDDFMIRLSAALNRLVVALVVAGGLIGSALIGIFATEGPEIFGVHFLSVLGFFASMVLGLWLLVGVIRSGRL